MKTVVLAASLLLVAAVAQAETVVPAAAATPAAQPAAVRANGEHPGVLAARQARQGAIDANRFIVAPPASTHWTSGPAADAAAVRMANAAAR